MSRGDRAGGKRRGDGKRGGGKRGRGDPPTGDRAWGRGDRAGGERRGEDRSSVRGGAPETGGAGGRAAWGRGGRAGGESRGEDRSSVRGGAPETGAAVGRAAWGRGDRAGDERRGEARPSVRGGEPETGAAGGRAAWGPSDRAGGEPRGEPRPSVRGGELEIGDSDADPGGPGGTLALVEAALARAAEAVLPAAVRGGASLTRAVIERSRRYTSDRDLLDEELDGEAAAADLAARALFFAVADATKVGVPLAELDGRGLLPARDPLRVLDLGAGAGAMTLGVAAFLAGRGRPPRLQVVAVDRDRPALAVFERAAHHLADALGGRIDLEVRGELLRSAALEPGGHDLVVAGSVLNELDEPGRIALIERAIPALAEGGALVVIEPALRETSRDLHRLRDHVLGRGLAHVFAPCTRRSAPCPALARERDWCHEDRPLELPPRAARIAQVTGLRDGGMKFSYLVLRRGDEPLVEVDGGREAERVMADARKLKGRRECTGCGEDGWTRLRLLSRHRDDDNRALERARRGDVLVLARRAAPATSGTGASAPLEGDAAPTIDRVVDERRSSANEADGVVDTATAPLRDVIAGEAVARVVPTDPPG